MVEPQEDISEQLEPIAEHWTTFKRLPADYLVAAGGDTKVAALKAGVDEGSFLRALGSDDSISQVARSAHFLTLMHSLDLVTLAKEEIARRFVEAPSSIDDPESDDYDPEIANPAAIFPMKDLISIFKFGAEFIAVAAATASSPARPPGSAGATGRHVPPRIGKVIEASRGLPAARVEHSNPDFTSNPNPNPNPTAQDPLPSDAERALGTMADRLANSPPEVRAMFQEALDRAAEQQAQLLER